LRKRVADIASETSKLNSEIETNSKDSSQYNQLERKYEALIKNKENLEGQLADYNLALDKVRSHVLLFHDYVHTTHTNNNHPPTNLIIEPKFIYSSENIFYSCFID